MKKFFKKAGVALMSFGALALGFFSQLTVSSGGVIALESSETQGLMEGVTNAMSSLFNMVIGLWPIMLIITVVGIAIGLILGLLRRVRTRR